MGDVSLQGVRVILVDDHPAVREGLSLLLANKGLVVCGEADRREEAIGLIGSAAADVVLVDLSLGKESGIDLLADIKALGVKTLVYSMHDDGERVDAALAAGANGYVTKREVAATLLEAIGCILSGACYLSPIAAEAVREQASTGEGRVMVERLSERELDIFRKMGEGYSTADLAGFFEISPSTVETYYARIMEKLDLYGAKEIRIKAIRFMKSR
jgi:DNA-binding NarL/FixJ family response regulator